MAPRARRTPPTPVRGVPSIPRDPAGHVDRPWGCRTCNLRESRGVVELAAGSGRRPLVAGVDYPSSHRQCCPPWLGWAATPWLGLVVGGCRCAPGGVGGAVGRGGRQLKRLRRTASSLAAARMVPPVAWFASGVMGRVLATIGPSASAPSSAVQRSRLWARVEHQPGSVGRVHPGGQWLRPAPSLRSRIASSCTAWWRWSASRSTTRRGGR
jgi:hypothetical protein